MVKQYHLCKSTCIVKNILDWDSEFWLNVEIADIDNFHQKSSEHHPKTQAKLQYDENGIYVIFKVEDKFIRSIYTKYNAKVNEDSCVEWFVKPSLSKGYFNFEMNAIGTLHVNYIVDPERDKRGNRKDVRSIPESHANQIGIFTSLSGIIDAEISEDITWFLAMNIPFAFFKKYIHLEKIDGSIWQGNLYKCGDKTSKPHWAAWSPVAELNFHQPIHFGEFVISNREKPQ